MNKFWLTALGVASLLCFSCAPVDERDPLLIEADSGNREAQYQWAKRLEEVGDIEKAIDWYAKAAVQGHEEAGMTEIDHLLGRGNSKVGVEKLEAMAAKDVLAAKILLGRLLDEGIVVERDAERALPLLKLGLENGDSYALFQKARKEHAVEVLESETLTREARRDLDIAGRAGSAEAMYLLAVNCMKIEQVEAADKLFKKAADLGHAQSMYEIAKAYFRLGGAAGYSTVGFEYLSRAEELGVFEGLYLLSKAYDRGWGVSVDEEKSQRYLELAATFGSEEAIRSQHVRYYKKEETTLDDQVDLMALRMYTENEFEREMYTIANKLKWRDKVFDIEKIVAYRKSQFDLMHRQYVSTRDDSVLKLNAEEEALLNRSFFDNLGENESLYRSAIEEDEEAAYNLSKVFLNSSNELFDADKALLWLRRSAESGSSKASMELYRASRDNFDGGFSFPVDSGYEYLRLAALQDNVEAKMVLAKALEAGDEIAQNLTHATNLYLESWDLGNEQAYIEAKRLIRTNDEIFLTGSLAEALYQELAKEGLPRFRFWQADKTIESYERQESVLMGRPLRSIVSEIAAKTAVVGVSISNAVAADLKRKSVFEKRYSKTRLMDLSGDVLFAVETISELADEGYEPAVLKRSFWKFWGFYGLENRREAMDTWNELSQGEGNAKAKYLYGFALFRGFMTDLDFEEAGRLLRFAAENKIDNAQAFFVAERTKPYYRNKELVSYAYQASELGEPNAMVAFARTIKKNKDYEKEFRESEFLKWITRAVEAGSLAAHVDIGSVYLKGDGVEKDVPRGMEFLEKAANGGYVSAQYYIGVIYANGELVERNYEKSIEYLTMASEAGNEKAQDLLFKIGQAQGL